MLAPAHFCRGSRTANRGGHLPRSRGARHERQGGVAASSYSASYCGRLCCCRPARKPARRRAIVRSREDLPSSGKVFAIKTARRSKVWQLKITAVDAKADVLLDRRLNVPDEADGLIDYPALITAAEKFAHGLEKILAKTVTRRCRECREARGGRIARDRPRGGANELSFAVFGSARSARLASHRRRIAGDFGRDGTAPTRTWGN